MVYYRHCDVSDKFQLEGNLYSWQRHDYMDRE